MPCTAIVHLDEVGARWQLGKIQLKLLGVGLYLLCPHLLALAIDELQQHALAEGLEDFQSRDILYWIGVEQRNLGVSIENHFCLLRVENTAFWRLDTQAVKVAASLRFGVLMLVVAHHA